MEEVRLTLRRGDHHSPANNGTSSIVPYVISPLRSAYPLTPAPTCPTTDLPGTVTRQSGRRAGSDSHLCVADTSTDTRTPALTAAHEAHVRPRALALHHLQQPNSETPSPSNRHVSHLALRCQCTGLGNCSVGPRGRHGLHRGCRD